MFKFIKELLILVLISTANYLKCISIKNQECKVRKAIIDNDSMTFPYKIKVDKCVGSWNDVNNRYFKVYNPEIVKSISLKSFDLISRKNVLKNVSFHESCKCGFLLDEKVCNNKQKWNSSESSKSVLVVKVS